MDSPNKPFLPANESRIFMRFFAFYSKMLSKKVFKHVYLDQHYTPDSSRSTLFFGNHSMWWDALTPLLLNEYVLHQRPRAIMEWEQMYKYKFFSRIGCFSIDRSNPRSALNSLQYGTDWLNKPGNSLYLYPEGKIVNPVKTTLEFESGIVRMLPKLAEHVDVVPLIQHINAMYHAKPSLFMRIGKPLDLNDLPTDRKHLLSILQSTVQQELNALLTDSSERSTGIRKLW